MSRKIGYNFQGNNYTENDLGPWSQCFTASNWMRMSFHCKKIKADDDVGLSEFLKYIEVKIGPKIIPVKHPSLYFDAQNAGVTKWLNDRGILGKDVSKTSFKIDDLIRILEYAPVTIGTYKMSGLPGGHMILLVDYDEIKNSFIVNDPAGNAVSDYKDRNGSEVLYPVSFLLPFIHIGNEFCRIQYFKSE